MIALGFAIAWLRTDPWAMTAEGLMEFLNARGVEEREFGSQLVDGQWYRYIVRREKIEP